MLYKYHISSVVYVYLCKSLGFTPFSSDYAKANNINVKKMKCKC